MVLPFGLMPTYLFSAQANRQSGFHTQYVVHRGYGI
jgi:hypothetical protein